MIRGTPRAAQQRVPTAATWRLSGAAAQHGAAAPLQWRGAAPDCACARGRDGRVPSSWAGGRGGAGRGAAGSGAGGGFRSGAFGGVPRWRSLARPRVQSGGR